MFSNNDSVDVEVFGHAKNHGKRFSKLSQTSFSGTLHYMQDPIRRNPLLGDSLKEVMGPTF